MGRGMTSLSVTHEVCCVRVTLNATCVDAHVFLPGTMRT
jgi:hypothetical protein